MTESPLTRRVLARRAWILVLGTLVGLAAAWSLTGIAVSATSAFAARAVGISQTPYQSARLALTYAQLLPEDPAVIGTVARETGTSRAYVRDHLTMSAEPETNVVYARFSAAESGIALRALEALTVALEHDHDAAGSNLRVSATPLSKPTLNNGFSRKKGLLLGAFLGFVLGLAIAIALERRRPRVDDLRLLSGVLPLPISQVTRSGLPGAVVGLGRDGGQEPLALIAVAGDRAPAEDLIVAAQSQGGRVARSGEPCALLIGRGAPATEIEAAWRNSAGSGARVIGALLVAPGPRWRPLRGGDDGLRAG